MYEGESLTVVVENPNGFERYFLDTQSGQLTIKPDTASRVIQGLLPSLQKAGEFKARALGFDEEKQKKTDVCQNIANGPVPAPGDEVDQMVDIASICLGQLATKALDIYQKLEPLIAPDSLTPIDLQRLNLACKLQNCIADFLASEIAFSSRRTTISKDSTLNTATNKTYATDMVAIAKLAALQKSGRQHSHRPSGILAAACRSASELRRTRWNGNSRLQSFSKEQPGRGQR
jgi:hypothetical protein